MFCFFCRPLKAILNRLDSIERTLMATSAELVTSLEGTVAQLVKIGGETATLLARVEDLQAALDEAVANSNVITPELIAAVAAVSAQATTVDEQVPDATVDPV